MIEQLLLRATDKEDLFFKLTSIQIRHRLPAPVGSLYVVKVSRVCGTPQNNNKSIVFISRQSKIFLWSCTKDPKRKSIEHCTKSRGHNKDGMLLMCVYQVLTRI